MPLLRRKGSDPDDAEPAAPADDAGAGEDADEQVPVGPTGRPLQPVGAYFETAFRRFGINFSGYLLMTAVCGLPTVAAIIAFRSTALSGEAMGVILSMAYALGFVVVAALATLLVAGGTRERLPSILVTCAVTGVLAGLVVWQVVFLAIVLLPFLLFPPIIAASGDAGGLRAVAAGAAASVRWFRRAYACVFGLVIVAVALWVGFTGLFFAVPGSLRGDLIIGFTSLFMWPVAALVFRNLYGDMTGRLVVREAPGENQRRREAMKAKRERGRRNRKRLERVADDD